MIEFQSRFATQSACAQYLFERRWPDGFAGVAVRAWLLKTKAFTYQRADCGRQTSVTAGMIMHAGKLPLTVPGRLFDGDALQRHLGVMPTSA